MRACEIDVGLRMRIAILNRNRRLLGGVESYLYSLIPELRRLGHSLAFMYEVDEPLNREMMAFSDDVTTWGVSERGVQGSLAALRNWKPELIFSHGVTNPTLEAATLEIAPAVFFAHVYHGTCISGTKTFKNSQFVPCNRRFGWQCLFHYYPHRCGGWSPVTMVQQYKIQSQRLKLLSSYGAIVTNSEHMRLEYLKHGFNSGRVHRAPLFVETRSTEMTQLDECDDLSLSRLLFVGRMDELKGGHIFLESLSKVQARLARQLTVTLAGDGPCRIGWEQMANSLQRSNSNINVKFSGWADAIQLDGLMTNCDLFVMPSLWPEPFGLLGLEAGKHGVPVAAFAVGGIPEWLKEGINGHLASGSPPTSDGLSEVIIKCLESPLTHTSLRRGALEVARQFSLAQHLSVILNVFEEVTNANSHIA